MKVKSLFSIIMSSVFLAGGMTAAASPADKTGVINQAEVKLLSAKIENAIADLPDSRTETAIQNAAFFILADQGAKFNLKIAAIDEVIEHARLIDDEQVVNALKAIDIGLNNVKKTEENSEPKTVSQKQRTALISAPPSTATKSGSDY